MRWLWPRSLRNRVAMLIFLSGSVLVVLVVQQTLTGAESHIRTHASATESVVADVAAALSGQAIEMGDLGSLQATVSGVADSAGVGRVTVLDNAGLVVADSTAGATGEALVVSGSQDQSRVVIRDVFGDSGSLGTIRIAFVDHIQLAPVDRARERGIVIGLMAVGIVALGALGVGSYVSRRLRRLGKELETVDEAGIPLPVAVQGSDEVAELAMALNDRTYALRTATAERLLAIEALRKNEQTLTLLLDATTDGMFEHRIDQPEVTMVGSHPATVGGAAKASTEDLIGLVHHEDQERLLSGIAHHVRTCTDRFSEDVRMQLPGGEWRSYSLRGRGLDPVEGRPTRIVGAIIDVTRSRELEAQLAHADKMSTIGRMVAGLTHDFNNILAVIQLNLGLLATEDRDGSLDSFRLDQIRSMADRAGELVDGLLRLSHPPSIGHGPVDFNALIRDVVAVVVPILDERIAADLDLSAEPAMVHVDRSRAEQILLNILSNASDAITGPGVIGIRTAVRAPRADSMEGSPAAGAHVVLEVRDTGEGIAAEVEHSLFEPFVTTKPLGAGTGLGLSTAMETVVGAGGSIEAAANIDDSGTTFTVTLPLEPTRPGAETLAPTVVPKSDLAHSALAETVLVVDDKVEVLGVVGAALDLRGFRVIEALGGVEALETAKGLAGLDILVTDVMMPDLNGPELAALVRGLHPEVKVLFMTGGGEAQIESVVDQPLIRKPFTSEDLIERVNRVLDHSAAEASHDAAVSS